MLRNSSLIVCPALDAPGFACLNAPAPPPDTHAADAQAVKDVEVAWAKDAGSKDVDKYVSSFADDGSGLYPGRESWMGRQRSRRP
jgi:hypothetical protein